MRNALPLADPITGQRVYLNAQRRISAPCRAGDSGAPVFRDDDEERNEAIGIVVAWSQKYCYYTHIEHAIDLLKNEHGVHELGVLISRPKRVTA